MQRTVSLSHEVHAFNGKMGPQGADDVPFMANLARHATAEQQRDTSIIMVCRDRKETQLRAVEAACNASAGEVVVVDWSSKPSEAVDDWTQCPNGVQLQVIHVEQETTWELGRAYNLALTFATRRNVLKIDCDSILTPDFLSAHPDPAANNRFYAGNWKVARDQQEIHLNGIVYASREHWLRVGGYDERITSYGWDDDDLYNRLQKHARRLNINYDKVSHMPHQPQTPPAVSREPFSGFAHPALDFSSPASTSLTLQLSTQLNRLYLEEVGTWSSERLTSLYGCESNSIWDWSHTVQARSNRTVCRALFKPWPLHTYKLSPGGAMKAVLSALHVLSEIPDKCSKCVEPLSLRRQWRRTCAERFDAAWGAAEAQSKPIDDKPPWMDAYGFMKWAIGGDDDDESTAKRCLAEFSGTLPIQTLRKRSRVKGAARERTELTSENSASKAGGADEASPCRDFIQKCGSVTEQALVAAQAAPRPHVTRGLAR